MNQPYTVKEIAQMLRVSVPTATKLCKAKPFPVIPIGKTFRIPREGFELYMKGGTE